MRLLLVEDAGKDAIHCENTDDSKKKTKQSSPSLAF